MASPTPFVLHSRAAHRVFGWCARCPGRDLSEEVWAWRERETPVLASVCIGPAPEEAGHAGP